MIPKSLTDQCVEKIEAAILSGELPQGSKLKVNDLKIMLNAGGSPIREALTRLVATGFVEMRANRGFYVTELTPELIRDLHTVYADIESLVIERAIAHGDSQWEATIVSSFHLLSTLERQFPFEDVRAYIKANQHFHQAIASACGSPTLLEIRRLLEIRLERCLWHHIEQADAALVALNHAEHSALKDAILARDTAQAIKLSRQHILGGLEHINQKG